MLLKRSFFDSGVDSGSCCNDAFEALPSKRPSSVADHRSDDHDDHDNDKYVIMCLPFIVEAFALSMLHGCWEGKKHQTLHFLCSLPILWFPFLFGFSFQAQENLHTHWLPPKGSAADGGNGDRQLNRNIALIVTVYDLLIHDSTDSYLWCKCNRLSGRKRLGRLSVVFSYFLKFATRMAFAGLFGLSWERYIMWWLLSLIDVIRLLKNLFTNLKVYAHSSSLRNDCCDILNIYSKFLTYLKVNFHYFLVITSLITKSFGLLCDANDPIGGQYCSQCGGSQLCGRSISCRQEARQAKARDRQAKQGSRELVFVPWFRRAHEGSIDHLGQTAATAAAALSLSQKPAYIFYTWC